MPRRGRGRGRSAGRGRGNREHLVQSESGAEAVEEKNELNIEIDPKAYFTGTATAEQHLQGQKNNRTQYAATLALMVQNKIEVTQNACIRALAMAWARGDQELASAFLDLKSHFGLVEVLRALNMLDAGRQARVVEKRLRYLQISGSKVSSQKLGKLKSDMDNLIKLKPSIGSASGAVCKHVSTWVRSFTTDELEFFSIHFPKDPWKKLADICHLNPEKDFPTAPWFLPYCFGTGSPPPNSVVEHCQNITEENVNDLVKEHPIPFSVLLKFKKRLNTVSKARIAQFEPKLDTLIWWFEDLACPETEKAIYQRLSSGELITLPNGKLLERLVTITLLKNPEFNNPRGKPNLANKKIDIGADFFLATLVKIADSRLTSIRLSLESPVVVIGDASGSMEVAIRTSTIIAGLLTAICSAKLVFFNAATRDAPFLPKSVKGILRLALTTVAEGGTAPAASLYPFYENKEVVKTFIIVTDEEENLQKKGYRFAGLYKKYHDEVYPANLVFVSILKTQHAKGQMVQELNNIGFYPKQLRLENSRPDLSKLDDMFAQLSAATTSSFEEELHEKEDFVNKNGVIKLFQLLKETSVLGEVREA